MYEIRVHVDLGHFIYDMDIIFSYTRRKSSRECYSDVWVPARDNYNVRDTSATFPGQGVLECVYLVSVHHFATFGVDVRNVMNVIIRFRVAFQKPLTVRSAMLRIFRVSFVR